MKKDTLERLESKFAEFPIMRSELLPTSDEIDKASIEVGVPFSSDYQAFLLRFGGAMVGAYPIFGLRPVSVMGDDRWSVVDVTRWYRKENVPGCNAWVIFSEDQAGNPVGMDRDGVIWIHDHDFGGITRLANDFEEYIRVRCLGLAAV